MRSERGATAVLVAGAMFFLFGAAALAVDVSMFYGSARTAQKTADLSCLAGVVEGSDADKINMAVEFTKQNWPEMGGASVQPLTATSATLTSGSHQVLFETSVDADSDKMRVRVLEANDTSFARALGAGSVNVVQEAVCEASLSAGFSGLPFGIDVGGFDGWLQKENPCKGGTCHPLDIPRDDTNGTKEKLVRNATLGPDRLLAFHHGAETYSGPPAGMQATWCTSVSSGDTCHLVKTDQGVSAGHLADAMKGRLQQNTHSVCDGWRSNLDCTTLGQALGGSPTTVSSLGSKPSWWTGNIEAIYGPWTAAINHVYFDPGTPTKINCDVPRWGQAPVVSANLNWTPGNPFVDYGGKSDLKIIEFATVYITAPTQGNDTFGGNGNQLKHVGAVIVWFGENVSCSNDLPLPPPGEVTSSTIKLVSG